MLGDRSDEFGAGSSGKEKEKKNTSRQPKGTQPASTSSAEDIKLIRLQKVATMRDAGVNPFAYRFDRTHMAAELQSGNGELQNGEEKPGSESVAGRIMARRVFGKLAFLSLQARPTELLHFLILPVGIISPLFSTKLINKLLYYL